MMLVKNVMIEIGVLLVNENINQVRVNVMN